MADMSAIEYKALMGDGYDGHDGFGGSFLWVILIFLFFLAFSGNGLGFGGNSGGVSQVERDVLTSSCATQKEVLENRYANALQFANLSAQNAQCLKNKIKLFFMKIFNFFKRNFTAVGTYA